MEVRKFTDEDRPVVDEWCKAHGMPLFPPGWLPPAGYIVEGVACAFLYLTYGSDVAFLENVISNPDTTKEQRKEACKLISSAAEMACKFEGYRYIVGLTAIPSLAKTSEEHGYVVSEPKYMTLVKKVF